MAVASTAPAVTSFALNPLTTTFSRPRSCSGIYSSVAVYMLDASSECLPSGFNIARSSYFSPGLICPSGYYSACHDSTGAASIQTVTCCPTYNSLISLTCLDTRTLSGIWSSLYCTWTPPVGQTTQLPITLVANGNVATTTLSFVAPGGINAFGVRMVYQATDLSTSRSLTSGTSSSTTNPSTTSSQAVSSSSSSSTASAASGLSKGGIIGLAVAIPVGILIIAGMLFFWWRSKKNTRGAHAPVSQVDHQNYLQETKPQWHEAPATQTPAELPEHSTSQTSAVELPASRY